jgi:glycosyltransferase involved in cell wall biosynthesis
MKKIVFCYSIPDTFRFSTEIIEGLKHEGYDILLVSSNIDKLKEVADDLGVSYYSVNFYRKISFLSDLKSILQLTRYFRKYRPDIVIGGTPKASLISMISSKCARVPNRVYHVLGLPYETKKGLKRYIFKFIEFVTSVCATRIIPVSQSVSNEYLRNIRIKSSKINLFAPLTIAGVDLNRFNKERFADQREVIRNENGIPSESLVLGFVGRLSVEKGITDLIEMWSNLKEKYPFVFFLVVGEKEHRQPIDEVLFNNFISDNRVIHIPFTKEVERFMSIMDVFVFPSWREGFGNVNIEASSMGIPIVSYRVTGCIDSISDGISGILVEKSRIDKLEESVKYFLDSEENRNKFGSQGRSYVINNFSREKVALDFLMFCRSL